MEKRRKALNGSDSVKNIYLTFYLAVLIALVFILQAVAGDLTAFVLVSSEVINRPWTLLTSVFLHGSASHLLSNIFALAFFGFLLESIIGSRRFAFVFAVAGAFSGIASIFFYTATIGASGAIFGVIGALTILRPRMVVYAFGIPLPMAVASLLWALLDIGGFFYPSDIANLSHLAGLATGLVIGCKLRSRFREQKDKKERLLTEQELNVWENRYMRQ